MVTTRSPALRPETISVESLVTSPVVTVTRVAGSAVRIYGEHILLVVVAGQDGLGRHGNRACAAVGIEGDGSKRADRRLGAGRQRNRNVIQIGLCIGSRRQRADRTVHRLLGDSGNRDACGIADLDAGEYVLSDRNLHLNRTVLGNDHARLRRGGHAAAVYVYSRNRTRARSGYRAKTCLLVDLVHRRLNLRQRRGLLGLSLRDTCLRLRQCLLSLGQILLGSRTGFEQCFRVADRQFRLLHTDLCRFNRTVGRGLCGAVGLLQRTHRRGNRRGIHRKQDLTLGYGVAFADVQRLHLTCQQREHLHLIDGGNLAIQRVLRAHRTRGNIGYLNRSAV